MNSHQSNVEPIRVMIVDDHEMVRMGLATFLRFSSDLELVGEAANGHDAVRVCEEVQPDVVLMDMVMPAYGLDRERALANLLDRFPVPELRMFVASLEVTRESGGNLAEVFLKLAAAIRAANSGKPTLAPEAAQALIQRATRPPVPGHDLSAREREVLALMKRGLSNRSIAKRLVISLSTADFHVSNILGKLGAASRTEAVALAVQHHLVD